MRGRDPAVLQGFELRLEVRIVIRDVRAAVGREIEEAIRAAISNGRLKGNEKLPANVKLSVGGVDLSVEIDGSIELE